MERSGRRHVIIEGCDGTGKDFLIDQMLGKGHPERLPFPVVVHPRASTSLGGPVSQLDMWVSSDMAHLAAIDFTPGDPHRPRYLFNRHPLFSEPIYSQYRFVDRGLAGLFRNREWVRSSRQQLSEYAVLVICTPPWETVERNLKNSRGEHLRGVEENARKIYNEYAALQWPGITIRYDYTANNVDDLVSVILTNVEHF